MEHRSDDAGAFRWYQRPEIPGPWRISACALHAEELRKHRFVDAGEVVEVSGVRRNARFCAICDQPALIVVVERCTCERDVSRCPEHQNIGCGG